jgi:hypothetical protein
VLDIRARGRQPAQAEINRERGEALENRRIVCGPLGQFAAVGEACAVGRDEQELQHFDNPGPSAKSQRELVGPRSSVDDLLHMPELVGQLSEPLVSLALSQKSAGLVKVWRDRRTKLLNQLVERG